MLDALLERYLRDCLALDLKSSAGRATDDGSSWSSGDEKLVRYLELNARWAWLFRFSHDGDLELLLNEAKARVFRMRRQRISTRHGMLEADTQGEVMPVSQEELASRAGLTLRQYQRRLTNARARIHKAMGCSAESRKVA